VEAARMVIGPAMNRIGFCERCWSEVPRFHQEDHDRWHSMTGTQ
jgi:hypothetical protein